jgi:hypothetical protein
MSVQSSAAVPINGGELQTNVLSNKTSSSNYRGHLFSLLVSSQLTDGLAKLFNFDILRHGTSISNSFSILKQGVDPSRGGTGSAKGSIRYVIPCRNKFHVFKDVLRSCKGEVKIEFYGYKPNPQTGELETKKMYIAKSYELEFTLFQRITFPMQRLFCLKAHAYLAGLNSTFDRTELKIGNIAKSIFLGLTSMLSPTVKFMYTKEEIPTIFEEDLDYNGAAFKTGEALSNDRIGLVGILKHAKVENITKGFKENPLRTVIGVIQIVAGTALTLTGLGIIL